MSVLDSATMAAPPTTPTLIVTEGAYADTQPSATEPIISGNTFHAARNRPGTYAVTVRAGSYYDWIRSPVVVKADACNRAITVTLVAKLQKRI